MSTEDKKEMISEELFRKVLDLVHYTNELNGSYVLSHLQIEGFMKEAKEKGLVKKTYKDRLEELGSRQKKMASLSIPQQKINALFVCCVDYNNLVCDLLEELEKKTSCDDCEDNCAGCEA